MALETERLLTRLVELHAQETDTMKRKTAEGVILLLKIVLGRVGYTELATGNDEEPTPTGPAVKR